MSHHFQSVAHVPALYTKIFNNVAIPTKYPKHFNILLFLFFILLREGVYKGMPKSKRKSKRRIRNKKTIPLNLKSLGSDISKYPFVQIEWLDIEGDAGWSDTRALNKLSLPVCVSQGYLTSQKNGITRIFTDYIKTKDKETFETIGNTTIIPTSVIQSIKKLP